MSDEPVILKLGPDRTHHYAHRAESVCPVTQPETALHFNTKCYLAAQIRTTARLFVELACQGQCGTMSQVTWAEGWDTVEVELTVASLRPDAVIAAIEIAVTHTVDLQKAARLAMAAIPWIEVLADETLFSGDTPWTPEEPFPAWRASADLAPWTCEVCAQRRQTSEDTDAPPPWKSGPAPGSGERTYAGKMVDLYFPSGQKQREAFYVIQRFANGKCAEVVVCTEQGAILERERGEMTREGLARLNLIVKTYLGAFQEQGALVDECVRWRRWEYGSQFVARDTERFPFHYSWDATSQSWREVL